VLASNPQPSLWLFDFDNTLAALEKEVDWAASRTELESFLRSTGVDEAIFREFPSRNLPLYNALLKRFHDGSGDATALMERASVIIESYELCGIRNAAPLLGATELLQMLRRANKRISIVTSNSSRAVADWLDRHRLAHLVGAIVGRDSLLPLKPAPEMIMRALELSGATPQETVLVGDSEADVEAAQRANVRFFGVAVTFAARTRLEQVGAQEVFSSPADLAAHLNLACAS
jgi:HAD superfamily hydrolase (TIGR01509 family)